MVIAILDHRPYNEGHALILPKQHVQEVTALNHQQCLAIMKASQIVSAAIQSVYSPDGITICQNGGRFNELTHYQLHVIPRYSHQNFAEFYGEGDGETSFNLELQKTMIKLRLAIEGESE